ncbi:MAG TPA: alkaline phosphatase family protein [Candidatus Acidoferrum sp.]|nr:alkaline phosphatase family protein [Candidatus Acidoferrum sp.]
MTMDDLVLTLQHLVDRVIRRFRLGPPPVRSGRRLLIVQIDGLSGSVLDLALAHRAMPFLAHLIDRRGHRRHDMSVGLPTSTPAFQMAAMYGVRPDIPGFHYHDKRRRTDVYFPRSGDAAWVEATQAAGRPGIVEGGSTYGCVFTGGAANNVFNFATLKRPSGAGLLRVVSAFVVLAWVLVKGTARTIVEVTRAVLRLIADPVAESRRGWKWLLLKVGVSIWARQFFTLAVSRDLYAGVPAIYVNYLDYDVFAHTYGPRHRRALRALQRVDRSIHQLARVMRRVPEYQYDLYVLSDHGQAGTVPYQRVAGGPPFERRFFEEFLVLAPPEGRGAMPPRPRRLAAGIEAYRHAAPGVWQRFVNYLEEDFPWILGEVRQARQRHGVRVVVAGSNAFVYFLDTEAPLPLEAIDRRAPSLVDDLSRGRGIGFVLVRSAEGPLCVWRGKRYRLGDGDVGPFAGRPDLPIVLEGIRDLMAMPSAGDLVIYGNDAVEGNISFIPEQGAHAGPSADELHTFIVSPPVAHLAGPITHPIQLYDHFILYGIASDRGAAT